MEGNKRRGNKIKTKEININKSLIMKLKIRVKLTTHKA